MFGPKGYLNLGGTYISSMFIHLICTHFSTYDFSMVSLEQDASTDYASLPTHYLAHALIGGGCIWDPWIKVVKGLSAISRVRGPCSNLGQSESWIQAVQLSQFHQDSPNLQGWRKQQGWQLGFWPYHILMGQCLVPVFHVIQVCTCSYLSAPKCERVLLVSSPGSSPLHPIISIVLSSSFLLRAWDLTRLCILMLFGPTTLFQLPPGLIQVSVLLVLPYLQLGHTMSHFSSKAMRQSLSYGLPVRGVVFGKLHLPITHLSKTAQRYKREAMKPTVLPTISKQLCTNSTYVHMQSYDSHHWGIENNKYTYDYVHILSLNYSIF